MREWGERALAAARDLSDPPLTAASTAVLAVAAAFVGAVAGRQVAQLRGGGTRRHPRRRRTRASSGRPRQPRHRRAVPAPLRRRRRARAAWPRDRPRDGQGDISPILVPVLSNVLHTTGRIAQSADLLDGAVEAARLSGNAQALGWNLLSRAFTALAAGDLDTALDASPGERRGHARSRRQPGVHLRERRARQRALRERGGRARDRDPPDGRRRRGAAAHRQRLAGELLRAADPLLAGRQPTVAAERAARRATAWPRSGPPARRRDGKPRSRGGRARRGDAPRPPATRWPPHGGGLRRRPCRGRSGAHARRPRTRRANERTRAVAELERAIEQLDACGAVRYRQEAERELRKLGRHVHRRTRAANVHGAGVETLTQREIEVARLVVDRRTNPRSPANSSSASRRSRPTCAASSASSTSPRATKSPE